MSLNKQKSKCATTSTCVLHNHSPLSTLFVLIPLPQKEMFCEHFVFLVDEWCENYIITQKRCPPKVIGKEYWYGFLHLHRLFFLLPFFFFFFFLFPLWS